MAMPDFRCQRAAEKMISRAARGFKLKNENKEGSGSDRLDLRWLYYSTNIFGNMSKHTVPSFAL
jgi:hypothetical protein